MGIKITVAAGNSAAEDKKRADFICSGSHDEAVINQAISLLTKGGTLQLLDGDYFIEDFSNEGNSAIYAGYNDGNARVVNIIGDTENKSYNTCFGVVLHVPQKTMQAMDESLSYRVFYGCSAKPDMAPDWFTYTHVNNVNFENFYIKFFDASRKVIGIDCSNFGSSMIKQVGIYTDRYFPDRFLHLKPATPVPGSIGVISNPSSNDEMSRIGMDTVCAGGLHTAFYINETDKLIMRTCTAARCCYGYIFKGGLKTLTLLNCSDEGNTHLPLFTVKPGRPGHISNIDFNIERFNADYIPDDPEGNNEPHAVEEFPDSWFGFISYTLQGEAYGLKRFWKEGHGRNITTVNQNHSRSVLPEYPEYLETFFDPETNKTLTYNGKNWVDAMGNTVK
ncbi:MAG: hypothetical protein IKC82_07065 [Lentisphaeria bacterium]|nr:hypothetical protein [Lentisphaeria bacterium]